MSSIYNILIHFVFNLYNDVHLQFIVLLCSICLYLIMHINTINISLFLILVHT